MVDAAAMVIVEAPEPGAAIEVGLKVTVTPAGWPVADNATAASNPFKTEVVMVDVPLLPGNTETEVGDAEIVKFDAGGPASALIRPVPFGLPQPVAKSYPISAG